MSNKVFLRQDTIIEVDVIGDQNVASIDLMAREMGVLLTQLRSRGETTLVLDNLLQMGQVDPGGRKLVVELGKRLDYDKLAMLGKGGVLRLGANLMLRAMGRGSKIRFFTNQDEALRWLKS